MRGARTGSEAEGVAVVPLLAIAGAVVVGLSLGLLGSGGSILTVPALVYLVGQDEKVAIASSLGIVGLVAFAGSLPSALRGQVAWRSVLWFGLPSMLGAWLGATASVLVSGTTQLLVFSIVMLLASVFMLRSPVPVRDTEQRRRASGLVAIDGLLVGCLAGLVGVGGGFLIVPALVLLGGMRMRLAVGSSLMIIALQSASGFAKYLAVLEQQQLAIDWRVFATFSGIGVTGAFVGLYLGDKLPQSNLRRAFGLMLVGMAIFMLWRTLAVS
ncbi:MAG: putative membrane protein YfcA [Planctomycetota bacterium]